MWYPGDKKELEKMIDNFLKAEPNIKPPKKMYGILVPHAGYPYSGAIAGKAFSLLQHYINSHEIKKAVILGPSHYTYLRGAVTSDEATWSTPLGAIDTFNLEFPRLPISQEHSIDNQIPFIQKLGIKEILPIMIGEITQEEAEKIAKKISKIDAFYIFSSDLSHFLPYSYAAEKDKKTLEAIKNLDFNKEKIDACGFYPILVMMHLCKIKKTHPSLILYKNSGDITGDVSRVVGYASMYF